MANEAKTILSFFVFNCLAFDVLFHLNDDLIDDQAYVMCDLIVFFLSIRHFWEFLRIEFSINTARKRLELSLIKGKCSIEPIVAQNFKFS